VKGLLPRLLAGLLVWVVAGAALADGLQASEARLKAAFLFKFGDYVEWPAAPASNLPLRIGVVDDEELAAELSKLVANRQVGGRPVQVRRLHRGQALGDNEVLFVGRLADARLDELLEPLRGKPTLVVTESADGLREDSVINFVVMDGKLRFDLSLPAAAARRLRISSRLIPVARRVVEARP
jgi:hypothetical protein